MFFSELSGAENWFSEEIKNTETNGILKTLYSTEDFGDSVLQWKRNHL